MVYTTAVTQDQTEQAKEPTISPRELSVEELRFSTKIDRLVERRFCENLLVPILTRIETELENDAIGEYLSAVKEHVLNSLDDFKEAPMPMMSFPFPTLRRVRFKDPTTGKRLVFLTNNFT